MAYVATITFGSSYEEESVDMQLQLRGSWLACWNTAEKVAKRLGGFLTTMVEA